MRQTRGYNTIYLPWAGLTFPNSLHPSPSEPEMDPAEFFDQLARAGVNRLRVKLCGLQGPLNTDVQSFEPRLGEFNDWDGRLKEMVKAAIKSNVGLQVIPFDNSEFRFGWDDHAWNTKNGGFLDDARDVFDDPRAIDAAKARVQAVADACGDAIASWELCAEMAFIVTPEFWGVDTWAAMRPIVRGTLVPWVEEMVAFIHTIHSASVGNGQVFAPSGFDADPDHPSNVRNEIFRADGLDFALINWYGDRPLADKIAWLRACQDYTEKPVYVEQYAPWELGRDAPYTREPPDLSWSKAHEWAAACGEFGVVGPSRWPEIKGDFPDWWGYAAPELAEIAGVTRHLSDAVALEEWTGTGWSWDDSITSDGLSLVSSWGNGQHITAFLQWAEPGPKQIEVDVASLDERHAVTVFDCVTGEPAWSGWVKADLGTIVLDTDKTAVALYVKYDPEPEHLVTLTLSNPKTNDTTEIVLRSGDYVLSIRAEEATQ